MSTATLTSKRQITIPSDVCQRLGVTVGDRVEFVEVADGEFLLKVATDDVRALKGLLKKPKDPVSIEDMSLTIKRRGAGYKG
ncbi:MAG: AbrB/MazE/SpoVT family DNA-binding domain-containing protein [Burkholderiales bacterium]